MPPAVSCLECGQNSLGGVPVHSGRLCQACCMLLLRSATSQLCDRIMELSGGHRLHPVTVSRIVATALPEPLDRLRVLVELRVVGAVAVEGARREDCAEDFPSGSHERRFFPQLTRGQWGRAWPVSSRSIP